MTERHESSCSVYNMPAYPNGPCDCRFRDLNSQWRHVEGLQDDWDSYGALAPNPAAIRLGKLISYLFAEKVSVIANVDGGVHVAVNTDKVELELDIDENGNISGLVEPANSNIFHGLPDEALDKAVESHQDERSVI